jgi:DedD protein
MNMFKTDQAEDPAAMLKRRARQRLIGAVILVLTAIIVIPMLLDSEPRPLGKDIAVTIPSRSTPFVPKLEPAAVSTPLAADASVAQPELGAGVKASSSAAEPSNDAAKAETPMSEPARTEVKSPEPAKPDASAGKGAAKADTRVPVAPELHADAEAAKALAALEGREPKASGKFLVQIGAFSNEEKVKDLQAHLRKSGVETYTEKLKVSTGIRLRVRAGPFASRTEADQALAKVGSAGVAGAIVVPQ